MNLVSSMIAITMMSMGTAATAYYLSEPPIAMSRLSAQAQADAIVERLRIALQQGNYICQDSGAGTLLIKDGDCSSTSAATLQTVTVPSNCSVLSSYQGTTGTFVRCSGFGVATDKRGDMARHGVSRLIGAGPCNSELFPTPTTKYTSGQMYLCQESNNTPPADQLAGDPMEDGHFDLDTYSGFSQKGRHVHAWDDKNAKGQYNLMRSDESTNCNNVADLNATSVSTIKATVCGPLGTPLAITESLSTSQQFNLLVSNAHLSPMVRVDYAYTTSSNSTPVKVTCTEDTSVSLARTFDKCFVENPTSASPTAMRFTTGTAVSGTGLGTVKLEYLIVGFSKPNPHQLAGLIPTSTGLVNGTSSLPGKNNEYRNGAFVIQAVSALPSTLYRNISTSSLATLAGTTISSTPFGSNCSQPSARCYTSTGGTGLAANNVIYENSIFWHAAGGAYRTGGKPEYVPLNPATVSLYLQRANS